MKGQILEMLFYPHILVVLLLFFSYVIHEEINELSALEKVMKLSDQAIRDSSLMLLNCSKDHIADICPINIGKGTYGVRRLLISRGLVKELIFLSKSQ